MPTPSGGYLVLFLTRDEIEVHLLTPAGEPIPRRVDGPVVVPIVGIACSSPSVRLMSSRSGAVRARPPVFVNVQCGTGVESHKRALRLGARLTQWAYHEAGLNIPRLALELGRRCAG
jgi:hypothetical protein